MAREARSRALRRAASWELPVMLRISFSSVKVPYSLATGGLPQLDHARCVGAQLLEGPNGIVRPVPRVLLRGVHRTVLIIHQSLAGYRVHVLDEHIFQPAVAVRGDSEIPDSVVAVEVLDRG